MRGRPKAVQRALLGAVLAGVAVRVAFFLVEDGMYYPDQIFQYLEPGHARETGSGWLAWEYAVGARNWTLPAFWGGWIEIGRALGLRRLALYHFLMLVSALSSALVIPAAYRLGRALSSDAWTGVVLAGVFACFPLFGVLAPHTLSENPALVLATWAFAFHFEPGSERDPTGTRRALGAGALLGAAILCRTSFRVLVPAVLVDLFVRRRERQLLACLGGLAVAAAVLAVVDAVTWGRPFQSVTEFVAANRAMEHHLDATGTAAPWHFYLSEVLWGRLGPVGLLLALAVVPFARRRGLRVAFFWLLPLALFSAIGHKQERFAVAVVALLLVDAVVGASALVRSGKLSFATGQRGPWLVAASGAILCLSALPGSLSIPLRAHAGTFRAQSWIGTRDHATGVLVRGENANGGYLLMERSIPLAPFHPALADHELFDHVIADTPELERTMRAHPGFRPARTFEGTTVFRRVSAQ